MRVSDFLYFCVMTVQEIRLRFDHFNREIFGGKLPEPAFKVTGARHTMGSLRYRTQRTLTGGTRHYAFTLCMSNAFELTPDDWDDVLIHEMIHLEILSGTVSDTSAHGKLFRARMSQINSDFGRHITISRRMNTDELKSDGRIRLHHVCLCTLPDGRTGVCVTSPARYMAIRRALPRLYDISDVRWFVSSDPYFNSYPHSIRPRLYILKDPELSTSHE